MWFFPRGSLSFGGGGREKLSSMNENKARDDQKSEGDFCGFLDWSLF